MAETFAAMLGRARRSAHDPERGGQLTQERFAELLADCIISAKTTATTISNWERNRAQPRATDRAMLCAIVGVLLSCKGLASVDAANVMLASGGYASITEAELCSIAALQEARATAIS